MRMFVTTNWGSYLPADDLPIDLFFFVDDRERVATPLDHNHVVLRFLDRSEG